MAYYSLLKAPQCTTKLGMQHAPTRQNLLPGVGKQHADTECQTDNVQFPNTAQLPCDHYVGFHLSYFSS